MKDEEKDFFADIKAAGNDVCEGFVFLCRIFAAFVIQIEKVEQLEIQQSNEMKNVAAQLKKSNEQNAALEKIDDLEK